MYDVAGHSLHLVASTLTDDSDLAEQLVVQTILAHAPGPSTLQDLSASVFIAWLAWADPSEPLTSPSRGQGMLRAIRRLPADQRAALGLCRFGGHTYRSAAGVLERSPERTAQLLHDALTALTLPSDVDVQELPAA